MRQIFDFVKTTVVGGAIFLLPFAAVLLVVIKAGKMAVDSATPLAEKLPISKGEAVLAVYVVGTFLLSRVVWMIRTPKPHAVIGYDERRCEGWSLAVSALRSRMRA
ncbi:hypothetical protein [Methylocapsa aurea]|uniref:hypothetical protein n=1 Tax=Methylocapsa aurea TaxID=663610 RepID=UPI000559C35A|nr:hypothetical protein [Methylocapsa aurea]